MPDQLREGGEWEKRRKRRIDRGQCHALPPSLSPPFWHCRSLLLLFFWEGGKGIWLPRTVTERAIKTYARFNMFFSFFSDETADDVTAAGVTKAARGWRAALTSSAPPSSAGGPGGKIYS